MSNNFFRFKQFAVYQEYCAMKVGTDGVLLGSWVDIVRCNNILDVGTGTGLIALMLAQRSSKAIINAIDIDEGSVMQANQNIINSPFAQRINVQKKSYQDFAQENDKKYDLIVSNPPYFQGSLKSASLSRTNARHNDSLSFYEVITNGASLITKRGRIAMILPYEFKQTVLNHAASVKLFAKRITNVFPLPHKPAKRLLVEFSTDEQRSVEDNLTIELSRHQYSNEFNALTKQFYLDK